VICGRRGERNEFERRKSFLTSGEDRARAWTIKPGTTAVKAAGKIRGDVERGLIRAEVMHYDDFIAHGSEAKCREHGKLRLKRVPAAAGPRRWFWT
jgi:ribosome-binding ATPase YchF (GTP1/OBG family)